MSNKDYVNLETAKLLKEIGYTEPCNSYYATSIRTYKNTDSIYNLKHDTESYSYNSNKANPHVLDAPFLYDAQQWLREVHKINIVIELIFYSNYQT